MSNVSRYNFVKIFAAIRERLFLLFYVMRTNPSPESSSSSTIQIAMKFYVVDFHMELFCAAHVKLLQLSCYSHVESMDRGRWRGQARVKL